MFLLRPFFISLFCMLLTLQVNAQNLLNKKVSINAKREPLSKVLNDISRQGNFFFSYLSNVLPPDSIVTVSVKDKPVKQVLETLLGSDYIYKESGNYIIILRKSAVQNYFVVSGFVTDRTTGRKLPNASVYERQQLISTLTNNDGYFRLRLKERSPTAAISVSKDLYADTTLLVPAGQDQELDLNISPVTYQLKVVDVTGKHTLDRNWFAKVFLSSRQKLTTLNIGGFLADKPYQFSLTPGLGTHGRMSGQVVNKFSFNMIGGYAAGVDGVEVGTIFNMVKNDMKDVQISGFLNIVGGKASGVQIAGFHNNVGDSLTGVQIGGFSNIVGGDMEGVQTTGVAGTVKGKVRGVQLQGAVAIAGDSVKGIQVGGVISRAGGALEGNQTSGVISSAKGDVAGVQIAGVGNISGKTMRGVQIAGVFNYARRLKGLQVGIVNITDTTDGFSIGLVNIARKGYKKVSVFATDELPYNIAWKSGNKTIYSILTGGINNEPVPTWTAGLGVGNLWTISPALSLSTELYFTTLVRGSSTAQQLALRPSLQWKITNGIAIMGGPAFMMHMTGEGENVLPFKSSYPTIKLGDKVHSWLGWQAGITLF